ncbi:flavodoxin-dependent (E)-4-hydroxy-3-methylbut-2-enyl-diphosphate synthase [candidate division WOR-3 bacterium]|nr:flavodoxin-dependent (E)-4-hydroxy-3-methylbut-2-enyl-diphosphate synthase [candidate division WOR-3 bacterium]
MSRRWVSVGGVRIGAGAPVRVQTMTKSHDTPQIIKEIRRVYRAGAELVRVAVPDEETLKDLPQIIKKSPLPVIADVHFSPALALGAIEAGAAKLRINPGNIRSKRDLKKIAMTAKDRGIPIRIGVNSGSLPPAVIKRFKHPTAEAMIAALSDSVKLFEDFGFRDLVLAAKSSDVLTTIEAYRAMHEKFGYPLHLGVTEAGLPFEGAIRSTAAMAPLLLEGIGDTIRISLTGPAEKEVEACWELLRSLGLRERGVKLISCPGCARTEIDIQRLAREVKKRLAVIKEPLTVAVMGCVVNGPGEAKEADYGIAGGKGQGVIFRKGEIVATVSEEKLLDSLVSLIQKDLV